jgi:hypothetical protein
MAFLNKHGENDEPGREYDDELLAHVSANEHTADALKMKTKSIEESEGSRTPSVPNVGGTRKPTHGTLHTVETLMVLLLQLMIASTALRSRIAKTALLI